VADTVRDAVETDESASAAEIIREWFLPSARCGP
jgi:hypothetical protein